MFSHIRRIVSTYDGRQSCFWSAELGNQYTRGTYESRNFSPPMYPAVPARDGRWGASPDLEKEPRKHFRINRPPFWISEPKQKNENMQ